MNDENKIYILENEKNKDYLKNYSFYIPNYQRGYKWSKENIEDLLNDINSIGKDGKAEHCLHNLTIIEINDEKHPMYNLLKNKDENKKNYEVVDGQQRLTTIYLLLNYLNSEEIYNLYYQIREETKDFIEKKITYVINLIKDVKDIENNEKIKEIFSNLVKDNNNYNKQDIYFICDALFCMHQWFETHENNKIYDNLQNVYFYKHELENKNIKGETVFANLNSGRVPLTDIELIKADLIINISEEKNKSLNNNILLNEIRSNIGRLWDEMESFLAQDEVWYWIAANNKNTNKLSLLFDLIKIKTFKDYRDILENKKNNKTSNDILDDIKEAIEHINTYSSHHSEAILTSDMARAEQFLKEVDSAVVYVNASTRFSDGEEFGLGAEIGISTQKLHARGPMGIDVLSTYKYCIKGHGEVRG